jgi:Resolvase, N terminal domain
VRVNETLALPFDEDSAFDSHHYAWRLIPDHYDDGSLSGASLDRSVLQGLVADVRARRINIVVVYKVDRLTRSLADFAKLQQIPVIWKRRRVGKATGSRRSLPSGRPTGSGLWPARWQAPAGPVGRAR